MSALISANNFRLHMTNRTVDNEIIALCKRGGKAGQHNCILSVEDFTDLIATAWPHTLQVLKPKEKCEWAESDVASPQLDFRHMSLG